MKLEHSTREQGVPGAIIIGNQTFPIIVGGPRAGCPMGPAPRQSALTTCAMKSFGKSTHSGVVQVHIVCNMNPGGTRMC